MSSYGLCLDPYTSPHTHVHTDCTHIEHISKTYAKKDKNFTIVSISTPLCRVGNNKHISLRPPDYRHYYT